MHTLSSSDHSTIGVNNVKLLKRQYGIKSNIEDIESSKKLQEANAKVTPNEDSEAYERKR